jgi:multiple sugar transport system permease protein
VAAASRTRRALRTGLAFLAPNILGFLAFTLLPLVLSLVLAFSNWDLRLHNMFKEETIRFVGLGNFVRLFTEPDFYRFLGNTLFFMMGIPFSIAGSLILALLLSREMKGTNRREYWLLVVGAVFVAACAVLAAVGAGATAMTILLVGLAGLLLVTGAAAGSTVYRTLYYLPSFTAGVAVYILWKKLYSPTTGPVNLSLQSPLADLSRFVADSPPALVHAGLVVCAALIALVFALGARRLRRMWTEGELGLGGAGIPVALIALPIVLMQVWLPWHPAALILAAAAAGWAAWQFSRCLAPRDFPAPRSAGFGTGAMFALLLMVVEFALVGIGIVLDRLPEMVNQADNGILSAPEWLTNYHWAKPAIMIMGFWAAIGSNNMLLYLAGLSNVPQHLYEAADVDGASRFQKFWHVTWPQLAPTTFFIVVMSMIGGLQGGFEMARTMTQGGPAGSTTTLSYFIYTEGFETGRLGYSSAVAWALFGLVFTVTLINWRFGNRYVND